MKDRKKYLYWAKFINKGDKVFRFDTRIYLEPIENIQTEDLCIGAIVGKNPGSAKGMRIGYDIQPINLDGDKLLPTVRSIILKAYSTKKIKPPKRGFIQVLNLFYLCNPNLYEAIKQINAIRKIEFCPSEKSSFPWVWYVWGKGYPELNKFKYRFQSLTTKLNFYFDYEKKEIIKQLPGPLDFAKHTQGLKHDFVVPFISEILK